MRLELTDKQKTAIEAILAKHERVEIIATKDEIKIIHIRRKEVKP